MNQSGYRQLSYREKQAKLFAFIAYGLMAAGLLMGLVFFVNLLWGLALSGLLFLVSFILAFVNKSGIEHTFFADHYDNIFKTFYWFLPCLLISYWLTFFIVGHFALLALWVWAAYRVVTGVLRLVSNKAYRL